MRRALITGLFVGTLFAVIGGCQRGPSKIAPAEAPIVPVSHPVQRSVTDYVDYTGRTNAKDTVSIQPRVTGYLVNMPFKEGADVKKGDLLFEIDPRPYQAQLEAAKASVSQNEASLRYAVATNARFKSASKIQQGAVSERELDQYQALEDQAIANLKLANANLDAAKLNLDWTKVTSPIDGRISRYFLTMGNLVNQDVTQLTTLVSMDSMYAYFDMDEPTYLRMNKAINEGSVVPAKATAAARPLLAAGVIGMMPPMGGQGPFLASAALAVGLVVQDVPVLMGLQGEEGYPHYGTINFIDNQVNPSTGSISVRGEFPNPRTGETNRLLMPGMFVRIRMPISQPYPAVLVIDRAVTSDQGLKYVYVVDAENKVQQRRVITGALQEDGLRVIRQGLEPTDWVVIGALQQVRLKMTVQPEQMSMPSLAAPAGQLAPPAIKGKAKKK